jgi:hypothetical protein
VSLAYAFLNLFPLLKGLQLLLQEKLSVPILKQLLLQSGVPPRRVDTRNAHATLVELGVTSGQRIEVHELEQETIDAEAESRGREQEEEDNNQPGAMSLQPSPSSSSSCAPVTIPAKDMVQGTGGWKYPSTIDVQRGSFARVSMPGDNSCL